MSFLAPLATPLIIASSAISAFGALKQGQEESKAAAFQAAQAERNRQIALADAAEAERQAALAEADKRKEAARLEARQRALFAKGGVTFEGTPLLTLAEQAAENEIEALRIRRTGQVQASRFRSEAENLGLQARQFRSASSSARTSGFFGAGTSLLSGATNVVLLESGAPLRLDL